MPGERAAARPVPADRRQCLAPHRAAGYARFRIARPRTAHSREAPADRRLRRAGKARSAGVRAELRRRGSDAGATLAALGGYHLLQPRAVFHGGQVAVGRPQGVTGIRSGIGEAAAAGFLNGLRPEGRPGGPPHHNKRTLMSLSAPSLASPEAIARYEPVIGLEVHVQLATATKIFCGCPTSFGAPPNTNVCPVCLGLPGALPVLSREAVELAIKGALALDCRVNPKSRFARKNYFYPDLPKGYQISQYDEPLGEHGFVDIVVDGALRRIGITRVHMEDDAGKSIHDGFRDSDRYTYVDLNRSGTPLVEIVTEPDMHSSEEAYAFLTELKQTLQYVGISTCDMEKGHLRCDANVSVRLCGAQKLGTKAEVKNLNSFRFLKMALDYEIARQVEILEEGGVIHQETRLWNTTEQRTIGMRSKEQA